jgi:hypothetical protein
VETRRIRTWALRGLVAAVAVVGLYYLAAERPPDPRERALVPTEWPVPELEGQVLFYAYDVIWAREIDVDDPHEVGGGPSIRPLEAPQMTAAQGARRLAFVLERDSGPQLRMFNFDSGRDSVVDHGIDPLWHGTGASLAFLRPVEPETCDGVECPGEVEVALAEPITATPTYTSSPGNYELIGWSGDLLLVSDLGEDRVVTVSVNGEVGEPELDPEEIDAASPDGLWMVAGIGDGGRPRLLTVTDGEIVDTTAIELDEEIEEATGVLGWSLGSSLLGLEVTVDGESQLAIGSPHDPSFSVVPGSEGITTDLEEQSLAWGMDEQSFIFQRQTEGSYEAVHCPRPDSQNCSVVLRSPRPMSLLALY